MDCTHMQGDVSALSVHGLEIEESGEKLVLGLACSECHQAYSLAGISKALCEAGQAENEVKGLPADLQDVHFADAVKVARFMKAYQILRGVFKYTPTLKGYRLDFPMRHPGLSKRAEEMKGTLERVLKEAAE